MSKKRILISDNSKDFVQLLVVFFSKQPNIEIVGVAYDGKQTLKMVEQTQPDVLLLDLIMPEMDGLEVVKKIYESDYKPKVYIISAVGNETINDIAIGYGVNQYFIKPINLIEIRNSILKEQ